MNCLSRRRFKTNMKTIIFRLFVTVLFHWKIRFELANECEQTEKDTRKPVIFIIIK